VAHLPLVAHLLLAEHLPLVAHLLLAEHLPLVAHLLLAEHLPLVEHLPLQALCRRVILLTKPPAPSMESVRTRFSR